MGYVRTLVGAILSLFVMTAFGAPRVIIDPTGEGVEFRRNLGGGASEVVGLIDNTSGGAFKFNLGFETGNTGANIPLVLGSTSNWSISADGVPNTGGIRLVGTSTGYAQLQQSTSDAALGLVTGGGMTTGTAMQMALFPTTFNGVGAGAFSGTTYAGKLVVGRSLGTASPNVIATFDTAGITLSRPTTFSGGFAAQTISGAVTWSGAQTFNAGATVASGQTLALNGAFISGTLASGLVSKDGVGTNIDIGNSGSFTSGETSRFRIYEASTLLGFVGWDSATNSIKINNQIGGGSEITLGGGAINLNKPVTAGTASGTNKAFGISRFSKVDITPSGTANPDVYDDLVIGSTDTVNTGMTIFSTGQGGIAFGDVASNTAGQVRYQHGTGTLELKAETAITLDKPVTNIVGAFNATTLTHTLVADTAAANAYSGFGIKENGTVKWSIMNYYNSSGVTGVGADDSLAFGGTSGYRMWLTPTGTLVVGDSTAPNAVIGGSVINLNKPVQLSPTTAALYGWLNRRVSSGTDDVFIHHEIQGILDLSVGVDSSNNFVIGSAAGAPGSTVWTAKNIRIATDKDIILGNAKTGNTHEVWGSNLEARSDANTTTGLYVVNENAGASASSIISAGVTGGGDAFYRAAIGTSRSWAWGVDNSDGDSWKLSTLAGGTAIPGGPGNDTPISVDTSGNVTFGIGNVSIGQKGLLGITRTNIDDQANSLSWPLLNGTLVLVTGRNVSGYGSFFAMFMVEADSTPACYEVIDPGNQFDCSTGILSGTTGTDGRFTVSPHTDGNIYFENRLGSTRAYTVHFFGGA